MVKQQQNAGMSMWLSTDHIFFYFFSRELHSICLAVYSPLKDSFSIFFKLSSVCLSFLKDKQRSKKTVALQRFTDHVWGAPVQELFTGISQKHRDVSPWISMPGCQTLSIFWAWSVVKEAIYFKFQIVFPN